MYIDTHAHLNYTDQYGDPDELIAAMREQGVDKTIAVGFDLPSSQAAAETAERYDGVYFAPGIHPSETEGATDANYAALQALLSREKAVAVGETGLDYHYEQTNASVQKQAFLRQLQLAHDHRLPLIIHSRDAAADTLNFLREHRDLLTYGAVMHCFSGSVEMAKAYLDLGLYISFAGPVTFKNARGLTEVAKFVPADRLLSETDSPYLAPEPLRGTVNTPCNVRLIVRKFAELRGEYEEATANTIARNAHTLFYKLKRG